MKLARKVGATSQILQIFIADSSSTTGAGLTGLVFNSSGLTAYYHRDTDTTATAISLVTMTVGTFTSSGFKEIDSTNMPGWYQLCPPNAALASGAKSVGIHLKGATNMAPLPIEIDLQADVNIEFYGGTAGTFSSGRPEVNTTHAAGTAWNSGAIGAATLASDTITAAKIAADAIGASELATDAVTEIVTAVLTTQMTEAYAADGAAPTVAQALMLIQQALTESSISSTTWTVKKLDGSTTAATLTINDATTPTSVTRTG
jgi:hypothetical protein